MNAKRRRAHDKLAALPGVRAVRRPIRPDGDEDFDLFYVRTPDQCTKADFGWYYDVDPKAGTPTKIVVCPRTCDTLQASRGASIEIKLGCATVAPL